MAQERRFYIKKDDEDPPCQVKILNPDGSARDLTECSDFKFSMGLQGATPKVDLADATPVLLSQGVIQYDFTSTDTNTVAEYRAEFSFVNENSRLETFPKDGYIIIEVLEDIA